MDLFENAVFMLSCGWVKTELFEKSDVTTSICDVSGHVHRSLGITQGHIDRLFSFMEVRTSNMLASHFVHGNIIENAPRVDADVCLYG